MSQVSTDDFRHAHPTPWVTLLPLVHKDCLNPATSQKTPGWTYIATRVQREGKRENGFLLYFQCSGFSLLSHRFGRSSGHSHSFNLE